MHVHAYVQVTCKLRQTWYQLVVVFMTNRQRCLPSLAMNRQGMMKKKSKASTKIAMAQKVRARVQVSETRHLRIAPNFVVVLTTTRLTCLPSFAMNRQGMTKASAKRHWPWDRIIQRLPRFCKYPKHVTSEWRQTWQSCLWPLCARAYQDLPWTAKVWWRHLQQRTRHRARKILRGPRLCKYPKLVTSKLHQTL